MSGRYKLLLVDRTGKTVVEKELDRFEIGEGEFLTIIRMYHSEPQTHSQFEQAAPETSAAFVERELQVRLKKQETVSPEAMHREAVAGALMNLAAAVRAGNVTSVEYTWESPEDPVCVVKLREATGAGRTGIVLETDLAELLGEKDGD